jgi:hypothetical protein
MNPTKTWCYLRCSERVSSSCSSSGTCRIILVKIPVIRHERGKENVNMITINGAYLGSYVTQKFCSRFCSNFLPPMLVLCICLLMECVLCDEYELFTNSLLKLWVLIPDHHEVYSIQLYVIKFISDSDFRQVGGFLWVLQFLPPIKLTATI